MDHRRTLLASVLTLLALAGRGEAQQPGSNPKQEPRAAIGAELVAINQCVREVRVANPGTEFDAHIGTRGAFRYLGTDAEIAAFKRCMQEKGFPVDPK
jgi:hypothetical protein